MRTLRGSGDPSIVICYYGTQEIIWFPTAVSQPGWNRLESEKAWEWFLKMKKVKWCQLKEGSAACLTYIAVLEVPLTIFIHFFKRTYEWDFTKLLFQHCILFLNSLLPTIPSCSCETWKIVQRTFRNLFRLCQVSWYTCNMQNQQTPFPRYLLTPDIFSLRDKNLQRIFELVGRHEA